MAKIKNVKGRQVFDSRGNPTVEAEVFLDNNISATAISPSGASTGAFEAHELRDEDKNKFLGKSVNTAVENINSKISSKLIGLDADQQEIIDKTLLDLDGSENKTNLGANATLAVSLANAKCSAIVNNKSLFKNLGKSFSLPIPLMNIINGGSHSDAPIAFQEFMVMPVAADSFSKAMQMGTEIFHHLKKVLHDRNLSTAVGDEGGFAPTLDGTEDALDTIIKAITNAGYKAGEEVMIALDCASAEFYVDGKYDYTKFEGDKGVVRTSEEQAEYLAELCEKYPIISIEDGMDENDWDGWKSLTDKVGDKVQLVGDDLFVTNVERLSRGIENGIENSILIKVNKIGTLSETIDAVNMAKNAGYTSVMSHRSGETEDNTIADLAVALNTGQIKTGSASRSDRMAKYNQLLRIEEELADVAYYPQEQAFKI